MNWMIRLIKGAFIGTGFILPGVSGGALAAIFGLYERMISFMAHLTKDFKSNIMFFLPVGLGMLAGIVLLSYPLGFFLANYQAPTMWFFIGAILGTFPSLWAEAGKKGRAPKHLLIMAATALIGLFFLRFGANAIHGQVPLTPVTWIAAGIIIALGTLIPGLSPSNFLLYMGMYRPMVDAFKHFDLSILIFIGIGGVACLLASSKLVDWLFNRAYTGLFHIILGIVIASTLMIVPLNYNYLSLNLFACLITCGGGIVLGLWMSGLEETYR